MTGSRTNNRVTAADIERAMAVHSTDDQVRLRVDPDETVARTSEGTPLEQGSST